MRIGYDGRSYSDQEYVRILKVADIIAKRLTLGKPLCVSNFFNTNEYVQLSRTARAESLNVLCKKRGAIKLKFRCLSSSNAPSFYAANLNDIESVGDLYEFISVVDVSSVSDDIVTALKSVKETNISGLAANVSRFKKLRALDRKNLLDNMECCGLIKTKRVKNGPKESIFVSLKEKTDMSEEMKAKTKSEELIEQANKLLAAAEEAKKEEEKQLSKHEIMNIQREINVEIIEMEKQIDGIIDSFSKLKNLFDKLKQS